MATKKPFALQTSKASKPPSLVLSRQFRVPGFLPAWRPGSICCDRGARIVQRVVMYMTTTTAAIRHRETKPACQAITL